MSAYAENLQCRYRVLRTSPAVCDLTITVIDFRLQEGEVCENDFLQVAEERLCGSIERGMTSQCIPFKNHYFFLYVAVPVFKRLIFDGKISSQITTTINENKNFVRVCYLFNNNVLFWSHSWLWILTILVIMEQIHNFESTIFFENFPLETRVRLLLFKI